MNTGSCLCGAIAFEVEASYDAFMFCHCTYCQKDTGSVHGANIIANNAKLTWVQGADNITTFNLPGTRHTKSFCQTCGSAMPYLLEGKTLIMPAGSLDDKAQVKPTAHIFCQSRAEFEDELSTIPRFDKFPAES